MWEFPSDHGFFIKVIAGAFILLVPLIISAISWAGVYRAIQPGSTKTNREFARSLLIGTVAALIAVYMFFGVILGRSGDDECRNLDLDRVKSVLFRKMDDERTFARAALVFDDGAKIRDGLIRLRRASTRARYRQKSGKYGKEHFTSGYRIELMPDDGAPAPVLYYFSASEKSPHADVVIARCGGGDGEIDRNETLYVSTPFGDWMREHIEPVFSRPR